MMRIIVGIDGSGQSAAAAAVAAKLAEQIGAKVIAVHSFGLLERFDPYKGHVPSSERRAVVADRLESWTASLADLDLDLERLVVDGNAVEALLGAVEHEDDLIVVGRRGAGSGSGSRASTTLGSTSSQLAQRSPVPVLIVPDPTEDQP
ncbi:MAG: universal stress protein [Acidimicrobiales bacterium]